MACFLLPKRSFGDTGAYSGLCSLPGCIPRGWVIPQAPRAGGGWVLSHCGRGKGLLQVVINSSGRFHGQFLGLRCFDEEEMLMADYFSLMILRGISS